MSCIIRCVPSHITPLRVVLCRLICCGDDAVLQWLLDSTEKGRPLILHPRYTYVTTPETEAFLREAVSWGRRCFIHPSLSKIQESSILFVLFFFNFLCCSSVWNSWMNLGMNTCNRFRTKLLWKESVVRCFAEMMYHSSHPIIFFVRCVHSHGDHHQIFEGVRKVHPTVDRNAWFKFDPEIRDV